MKQTIFEDLVKIKDRGQLTIPISLRQQYDFLQPGSWLKIKASSKGINLEKAAVIKRSKKKVLTKRDWQAVKEDMKEASRLGRKKVSLSDFVIKDRLTH